MLGECVHCETPLILAQNWSALLLGRSYFCRSCGHPGPGLREMAAKRLQPARACKEKAVTVTAKERDASLQKVG